MCMAATGNRKQLPPAPRGRSVLGRNRQLLASRLLRDGKLLAAAVTAGCSVWYIPLLVLSGCCHGAVLPELTLVDYALPLCIHFTESGNQPALRLSRICFFPHHYYYY